jgi:ketosteroid isomerase-like protein
VPHSSILGEMSQENIDIVLGNLKAFNETGDVDAAFANADPEIEFEISTQAGRDSADFRVYRGIDEVRSAIRDILTEFDHARFEIHDARDRGDRVVAILELFFQPKGSSAEFSTGRFGYVYTLRGGKVVRVQDFTHPDDALREVGLAE